MCSGMKTLTNIMNSRTLIKELNKYFVEMITLEESQH